MPHAAVGIGLGVLAAGAITAIVAKEVIENWDTIHDHYDDFADRMEHEHDLHLPRFRDPHQRHRYAHSSRPANYTPHGARSFTAPNDDMEGTGYTSARETSRTMSARSTPFRFTDEGAHVQTPPHAYQSPFDDDDIDDDPDFRAAIKASLATSVSESYFAPEYPKAESFEVGGSTEEGEKAVVQRDVDEWSETWTVTDASEMSEVHQHEQWSDSEHYGSERRASLQ